MDEPAQPPKELPDAALLDFARAVGRTLLERQTPEGRISLDGWEELELKQPTALVESTVCDWTLTAVALANGAA